MKAYTTSLETLQHDVKVILDEKLKATSPEQTADYISFAIDNLASNIDRAKQAKKELDAYIKQQSDTMSTIKEQSAQWLNDCGIDKLDGMRISSLTTYTPVESEEFKILDNEFFIEKGFYKKVVDADAVKKYIFNLSDNQRLEISDKFKLEITHKQPTLKINKRKVKDV